MMLAKELEKGKKVALMGNKVNRVVASLQYWIVKSVA